MATIIRNRLLALGALRGVVPAGSTLESPRVFPGSFLVALFNRAVREGGP